MKAPAVATPLVEAIEGAWAAIQANHDDVPDVVVTLGSGIVRAGLKYGHFAPGAWAKGGSDESIHELFIGAEGLGRGARPLMGTLLHEAAHAWAEANGIQDTSRGGRYHNDKFRLIGETFGLKLTKDASLGWSTTELPDETADEYEEAIFALDLALTAHRKGPRMVQVTPGTPTTTPVAPTTRSGRKSNNNGVVLECGCESPRKIRVSRKVADLGPIVCGECGEQFTE